MWRHDSYANDQASDNGSYSTGRYQAESTSSTVSADCNRVEISPAGARRHLVQYLAQALLN
jgi:hypothetical protein